LKVYGPGLIGLMHGAEPRPVLEEDRSNLAVLTKWEERNGALLNFLLSTMAEERKERHAREEEAAKLWGNLKAYSTKHTLASAHATFAEFFNAIFDPEEETVEVFWSKLMDQVRELNGTGFYGPGGILPSMVLGVVCNALPQSYDKVKERLEDLNPSSSTLTRCTGGWWHMRRTWQLTKPKEREQTGLWASTSRRELARGTSRSALTVRSPTTGLNNASRQPFVSGTASLTRPRTRQSAWGRS